MKLSSKRLNMMMFSSPACCVNCSIPMPSFLRIKAGVVEDMDVYRELTQHATVISQLILDCAHHEVVSPTHHTHATPTNNKCDFVENFQSTCFKKMVIPMKPVSMLHHYSIMQDRSRIWQVEGGGEPIFLCQLAPV